MAHGGVNFTFTYVNTSTVQNIGAGTGYDFDNRISLGSAVAASKTDLSRHIALYGSAYGFNITSGTLGFVANTGYMELTSGGAFRVYDATPTNYTQITHSGSVGQIVTNTGDLLISPGGSQAFGADTSGYIWTQGALYILERANAYADVATYGQHWVKTATPNVAYFTDDAGGDWPVAGNGVSGNGIVKYKDTDTSRSSTITLTDDPDLAGWALEADTVYMIEAGLWFQSASSTPDLAWTFQFSNTPQSSKIVYENTAGNDITATRSKALTGGSQHGYNLIAYFHTNATTGGTIDFQWAQLVSDATAVVLEKGSWMRITKLGTA